MRLPLSKIHRAFPELDPFSDEQCMRYVASARKSHSLRRLATAACCLAALVVTVVVSLVAATFILRLTGHAGVAHRDPNPWLLALILLLIFLSGAVAAMVVRDSFLRSWIRSKILRATCVSCGYSLLGLPAAPDGSGRMTIQCPECGGENELAGRGMTIEEVQSLAADPTSPEPRVVSGRPDPSLR